MAKASSEKFTRCIICSSYSIQKQCFNIFNTTLDNGKILLSDFLNNALNCSVLIVVSPEFFLCKRCFSLCTELDASLSHCHQLQEAIQTLFKDGKENYQEKSVEESLVVKSESLPEDDRGFCEVVQEDYYNETHEEEIQSCFEAEEMTENNVDGRILETCISGRNGSFTGCAEPDQAVSPDRDTQEVEDKDRGSTDLTACKIWACEDCKMSFNSLQIFKNHMKTNGCNGNLKALGIQSTFEFKNYSVKLRKRKKVFFCNHCTYETSVSTSMEKHLMTHKTDPLYMCDVCGRRFKFMRTLRRHQQAHDASRPFDCKLCSFRAMTELKLNIHERLHDDHKKYVCSKCDYKTMKKMAFLIHSRSHTGERPYCCPNCPYRAKDPSTLIRHRRTHGGLKRYHCTVCDYKAMQKCSLTVHMMTHSGEKPFACSHCDYQSSVKHNLEAHVAARHCDDEPFPCPLCSYKTKVKRLLTYHMRRHSEEKPFTCTLCDYRARYRGTLRYHIKTKHPIGDKQCDHTGRNLNSCEIKRSHFQGENVEFSDNVGSESEDEPC